MKYVFGIFGAILLVIIAIVMIMGGGNKKKQSINSVDVSKEAREGVSAVLTTQGEVVGQDQRRAIRIIVNQDERRLEILSGYEESVERSSTFPNTNAAFENFLVALDFEGFDQKQNTKIKDERGACPLGRRYIYELREYSQNLIDLWGTSCGGKEGNFAGRSRTIRQLFERQIPNYDKLVRDVDLSGSKITKTL